VIATVEPERSHFAGDDDDRDEEGDHDAAIIHDGLRFNFFYLGYETGYRYARFLPEVTDEPMLRVAPALRQMARSHPRRLRMDLECLRGLPDFEVRLVEQNTDGSDAALCVQARHTTAGYSVMLFSAVSDDTGLEGTGWRVYIERDGNLLHFEPDFLRRDDGHVWLTEVLLEIERQMRGVTSDATPPAQPSRLAHARA
jgi:hypothetical protein